MSNEEKLRALLAEARGIACTHSTHERTVLARIDAALAEPVVKKPILDALRSAVSCETLERIVTERGQAIAALECEVIRLSRLEESLPASLRDAHDVVRGLERERDEARAEVRRTYKELSESIAREAEAYERGAEAMREAAASYLEEDAKFESVCMSTAAEIYAGVIRSLPRPEDK